MIDTGPILSNTQQNVFGSTEPLPTRARIMQILNYVIIKHQGSLVNDSAIPKTHDVYQEQASSGTSYSGSSSSEAANQVLTVNAANTSFTQKYT